MPLNPAKGKIVTSCVITQGQRARLQAIADREDMSVSALIRRAIKDWLAGQEKPTPGRRTTKR
jgi:hypothetical protein